LFPGRNHENDEIPEISKTVAIEQLLVQGRLCSEFAQMDCTAPPTHTRTHGFATPAALRLATPFRQSHELAEGQKSADVKRHFHCATPLRPPIEMAEGVGFLEENASFVDFRTSFGGTGHEK
jgi:hypothetical protein